MEGTVESPPLAGSGFLSAGKYVAGGCDHEIDDSELPVFDPRVGKVYSCVKCGAKVYRNMLWTPVPGKRVHRSKKERRRLK